MYQSMLKMGIPADAMLMEFYSKTTEQKLSYGIESIFQGEQDQEGSEVQENLRQKRREEVRKRLAAQENQVVDYEEDLDSDEIFDSEEELKTETSEGLESKEDSADKEIRIGIVSSQYQIFRASHFAEQALKKQREEGKVGASQKVSIVGFPSVEDPVLRPHLYFREALFLFGERLCHKL